ncbi:facilitated trehalose transporter Tret1-like [Oratosquilla oratoria]|uniref:facilitated trehalose transporter Tret1-like n=1 Tax=Oratosquilla oratoria TaxID=337810 RepID=UPI003F76695C
MEVFGSGNNLDVSGCVIDDGHLAKETHHGDGEGKIRVKEASPRLWSQDYSNDLNKFYDIWQQRLFFVLPRRGATGETGAVCGYRCDGPLHHGVQYVIHRGHSSRTDQRQLHRSVPRSRQCSVVRKMSKDFGSVEAMASSGLMRTKRLVVYEENEEGQSKKAQTQSPILWTQMLCAVVASMAHFSLGCSLAFPGVTLPGLTNVNTTDLYLDQTNAALFGGILNIGSMFGSIIGGILMVSIGQRRAILLSLPLTLCSWVAMALSTSVLLLQTIRIIQGISLGVSSLAVPNYVIEIASAKYRGRLGSVVDLSRGFGIFFMFCIGASSLTWRQLSLVCGITTTVPTFVGLLFLPDSPRWLATKRRYDQVEKSLRYFRGQDFDINPEMNAIINAAKQTDKPTVISQIGELRDRVLLKRFAIFMFICFFFQFSGQANVINYAVPIFEETGSAIDPYVCAILLGITRVAGALFYTLTADKFSRRKAFLYSVLVCTLSLACVSIYFYIKQEMPDEELLSRISFLPIVSLLVFAFSICTAIPVSLLHQRELLPLSFRWVGGSILNVVFILAIFLSIFIFPFMKEALTMYGTFAIFAVVALLLSFVPLVLLPETKGKTLEELEKAFDEKRARKLEIEKMIEKT